MKRKGGKGWCSVRRVEKKNVLPLSVKTVPFRVLVSKLTKKPKKLKDYKNNTKMRRFSPGKCEERTRRTSARKESILEESGYPEYDQKARTSRACCRSNLVSRLSTCVTTALLPPGSHVALVTAAAADLCPLVQRACCSMLT